MKAAFIPYDTAITDFRLTNTAAIDERIDETLDGGSVQLIMSDKTPIEPMTCGNLTISDSDSQISQDFFVFDTVEKRGKNYYIHNLSFCELTRLFMGIMIDGLKITQPTDETPKKSLLTVLQRVLNCCQLCKNGEEPLFTITDDSSVLDLLESTESPEFSWQAETLLWEVLCDIGNVINCIPRLKYPNVVMFDLINQVTGEAEL